ncbi:MAG: ABC transporter substrate-binding protein, partial [Planctomycetota bacterium]
MRTMSLAPPLFFLALMSALLGQVAPPGPPLRIYLDADRTGARSSGLAIERGIRTALDGLDGQIGGRAVTLVIRNHRGNAERSRSHLLEFTEDPQALALFCGLHSPPVLTHLKLIQEKKILLLNPWAAAGPITRATGADGRNWVFRLSIDDSKAGEVIVAHALDREGFKRPGLLLEDTGWGKSNFRTMTGALTQRGVPQAGCDVLFFVGNAPEGKTFLKAMAAREKGDRIPIRSHWGITGGDFFPVLGEEMLCKTVDLAFLQTRFSFLSPNQPPLATAVLQRAQRLFPDLKTAADLRAPCGFIHAYDLTLLLAAAGARCSLTPNSKKNRRLLQQALERLDQQVKGLIKTYQQPFRQFSSEDRDAHEALGIQDFRMARYAAGGEIRLI